MHVLSAQDTSALLSLLTADDRKFEAIAQQFTAAFSPSSQRFRACCAAALLLEVQRCMLCSVTS